MATISSVVRELYDHGERDPEKITEEVLRRLGEGDLGFEELVPVIRADVASHLRRFVRALEGAVRDFRPSSGDYVNPATEQRERLLRENVRVPGVGYVPWGQLTVEHHNSVISFYESRITGLVTTVSRHKDAIRVIESSPGAKCLDDCSPAVPAQEARLPTTPATAKGEAAGTAGPEMVRNPGLHAASEETGKWT